MDPDPMPWRAIESGPSAAAGTPGAGAEEAKPGAPRAVIAVVGAAALVAIAAFVLAFGSGATGSVDLEGGGAIGQLLTARASADGAGRFPASPDQSAVLIVEIVGAVERPGVYRLATGARLGDLLEAAGGYGPRVDTARASQVLNLAARLADGDQVRVPSRDDVAAAIGPTGPTGGAAGGPGGGRSTVIDLNRATAEELDTLPGVGPATAAKIIAARDETPFVSVDDLRSRKLVGQKTFEGLRDLVAVR